MELAYFVLEVVYLEFIEHDHFMVSMLTKQALETDGTEAVLAEGFDVLVAMYLTLGEVLIPVRDYLCLVLLLLLHHLLLLCDAELHVVGIVCVLTCRHILGVALDPH